MAIVFRIVFITLGIALVERFEWILYIFGIVLVITGVRMFGAKEQEDLDLSNNSIYKLLKRFLPIVPHDGEGKFSVRVNGKKYFTTMFVVVVMLATTDIVFAMDSIPAVFGISTNKLVIYTSNIFAVLGLRSLFFLLKGAVNKFAYLQQGIAIVLVFIGVKMLVEMVGVHVPVYISLLVILVCIAASIVYSIQVTNREQVDDEPPGDNVDLH
jgi:tellurite resistance protein TerC